MPALSDRQKYWLYSVIFLVVSAILLTIFLEYRYFINDYSRMWSFVFGSPAPFFFNAFLMFLMLAVLWGIIGKPATAASVMWGFLTILTYIHIKKFNSRSFPLLPEDFQQADQTATLTKFVDVGSIVRLVIAVLLIAALSFAFNKYLAKKLHLRYSTPSPSWAKRNMLGTRLPISMVANLQCVPISTICSCRYPTITQIRAGLHKGWTTTVTIRHRSSESMWHKYRAHIQSARMCGSRHRGR